MWNQTGPISSRVLCCGSASGPSKPAAVFFFFFFFFFISYLFHFSRDYVQVSIQRRKAVSRV